MRPAQSRRHVDRPAALRYAVPLVAVALATLFYALLEPILAGRILFIFYFPAILVSAWYGGLGAGLAATVLGAGAAHFFLLYPRIGWYPPSPADALAAGLFLLVGTLLAALVESLLRSRLRMAEARTEAERHLRAHAEAESRFQVAADGAPVMIWMAGADGGCDWLNKRWLEHTGRSLGDELGEGWRKGIHPEDRERAREAYRAAFDERLPVALEYRLRRADGEYRWVLDEGIPRFGPAGEFAGYVGSATDIHDRKEGERERERLLEAAEGASRTKDEFLGVVSHELRTPLNAILSWIQLLGMPEGRDRLDRGLEVIDRNVRLQIELVDQLLDLSRIVSGRMEIVREPVQLGPVAAAAVEELGSAASQRGVEVEVALGSGGALVLGDARRLQQVVSSLLRNSIKFTPEGGKVKLEVSRNGEELEIRVEDTGVGIRPDFLPHLFERFRQLDASTRRKYGGLGLGLALVRELVELHGGRVWGESAGADRGSCFVVRLPRYESSRAPGPLSRLAPAPRLEGVRVLVVEDDADARETMRLALDRAGAEVETASSGREALEVWQAGHFDVLLSDLGLPEIDGYELLERLRRMNGGVTAAAVTAFVGPEERRRARTVGFDAFLEKPLRLDRLVTAVAELAGRAPEDEE